MIDAYKPYADILSSSVVKSVQVQLDNWKSKAGCYNRAVSEALMQYKRNGDHNPLIKAFDGFEGLDSELEESRRALDNAYYLISFVKNTKLKGCKWLSRATRSLNQ